MRTWAKELQAHINHYQRRGGKQNRRKQVSLIIKFLEFTDAQEELTSLHRLGKRQVINFWKAHRMMPEKSAYQYWLGLCKLWSWLDKPDKPPKPHSPQSATESVTDNSNEENDIEDQPKTYTDIAEAISQTRITKALSTAKLANLTGLEIGIIEALESGRHDSISVRDFQILLQNLGLRMVLIA